MNQIGKVKQAICRLTEQECYIISDYAKERATTLRMAERNKNAAAVWEIAKKWKPGTTVYCNMSGLSLGGLVQRGTVAIVHCIQPRKKRLWLKLVSGKFCWYSPVGILGYKWGLTLPPNPVSESEAKMANRLGTAINSAFKEAGI